ncbi:MAG: His-Xaa-Ser system radical SAM maturase HxsC [Erythrobacter sp.]|nr:His-Xaa-Ser system radical SAM maturase HxsC [Erythrobacter sp.]MBA4163019.1 His-Xaa-Ser system radical SAM maturase HxsC [Erythrobacter sp.]
MIALTLPAASDADRPFVTRLGDGEKPAPTHSRLEHFEEGRSIWCGDHGLLEIFHAGENVQGDVVLVEPAKGRIERLIRTGSRHNTLLVTEQCDQLCVMCSQPPKKSHDDRFGHFTKACMLADEGTLIGISGGEPTLHMEKLLQMIEAVLARRPDLSFHVLSNGQHFTPEHAMRLRDPRYRRVAWGIPLYSSDPVRHDTIVGKPGAFERLMESFVTLFRAGARIELRTVLLSQNVADLAPLARFLAANLPQIEQWSVMGLENAGFARRNFGDLRVALPERFAEVAPALDLAVLHGLPVRLFNIPLCHVPPAYRHLAVASISDWKKRFASACDECRAQADCSGFFEWHPQELVDRVAPI